MPKMLSLDPEKCVGCRACMAICSLVKEEEINPSRSRINVLRKEFRGLYVPIACQQCDPPICREVCPFGSITRDEKTGAMLVDKNTCTLCKLCVKACPFHAIRIDNGHKDILICDLCGGEPQCVEWCPNEAIQFRSFSLSHRRNVLEDLLKSIKAAEKTKIRVVKR